MSVRCTDLRCERLVDPIGIGAATPRLTWRIEAGAGARDVVQRDHQVQALLVELELPPNTSATVSLPGQTARRVRSGRHAFSA